MIVHPFGICELIVNKKYEEILKKSCELVEENNNTYMHIDYIFKKKFNSINIEDKKYIIGQIESRYEQITKFSNGIQVDNGRTTGNVYDLDNPTDIYIKIKFSGKSKPADGILRRKREFIIVIIPEDKYELSIISEIAYMKHLYNMSNYIKITTDILKDINIPKENEFTLIDTNQHIKNIIHLTNKEISYISSADKKNIVNKTILASLYRSTNNIENFFSKMPLPLI